MPSGTLDWTQELSIKLPHLVLLEVAGTDLQAYNRALDVLKGFKSQMF